MWKSRGKVGKYNFWEKEYSTVYLYYMPQGFVFQSNGQYTNCSSPINHVPKGQDWKEREVSLASLSGDSSNNVSCIVKPGQSGLRKKVHIFYTLTLRNHNLCGLSHAYEHEHGFKTIRSGVWLPCCCCSRARRWLNWRPCGFDCGRGRIFWTFRSILSSCLSLT